MLYVITMSIGGWSQCEQLTLSRRDHRKQTGGGVEGWGWGGAESRGEQRNPFTADDGEGLEEEDSEDEEEEKVVVVVALRLTVGRQPRGWGGDLP